MHTHTLAWTAAVVAGFAFSAVAKPEQPPPPPREPPPAMDDAPSPERVRERIEEAIKQTEDAQRRLRAALERLDKGDGPAAVRRELDTPLLRMLLLREGRQGPQNDAFPEGGPRRGADGGGGGGDRRFGPGQAHRPMGPDRSERRGGEGGGPAHGDGPISPEERARLMEAVDRDMPKLSARLKELRESRPQAADRMLQRAAPRLRDAIAVRERDPVLYQLRIEEMRGDYAVLEAMQAARQARLLDDALPDTAAKRAEAQRALREALADAFDQRLRLDEHEATRLGERVAEIRAEIEKKRADKDTAVDDMIKRVEQGKMPPP